MKKRLICWMFLLISLSTAQGQTAILDSLRGLWWSLPQDTMRVMTGLRYGQRLFTHYPDLGLAVLNEAACLADSLYFVKGQFYSLTLTYDYYLNVGRSEDAWKQAQSIFAWSKRFERLVYKQEAYQKLGSAASNLNRPEAEEYFKQALSLGAAAAPEDKMALEADVRTRYLYSQFLLESGRSPEAMKILQEAVEMSQKAGEIEKEISLLGMVSALWSRLEEFDKAIETQRRVLRLRRTLEQPNGLAHSYQIIGGSYYGLKQNDSAIHYSELALQIFEETNDLPGISSSHNNLAQIYDKEKNVAKTNEHFQKAIDTYAKQQDFTAVVRTKLNLGAYQVRQGQVQTGLKAIREGREKADSINSQVLRRLGYLVSAESYQLLGRYRESYDYRQRYQSLKDSSINEQNIVTIAELEKKYETERKERKIASLKEEQAAQQVELLQLQQSLSRRKLTIYGLIGLGMIGLLLVWLFLQRHRLKQRQKAVEMQQRLLRSRMNPHFIFHSLDSIQSLYEEGDQLRANDYVADLGQLLRGILDHSGEELISLDSELSMLERYLRMEQQRLDQTFTYQVELDEMLDVYDILIPPLILQPLAENAIWHGIMPKDAKGHIQIRIWTKDDHLELEVADDGIGLSESRRLRKQQHDPLALSILVERLGGAHRLRLAERQNDKGEICGTIVRFSVPLRWRDTE
ncbi:MAG: histidine kinase [Bacteroidota bacterium]